MLVAATPLVACAHLSDATGFTYQGTPVKCLRDLPNESAPVVTDAVKVAIDVLQSDEFKVRAAQVLGAPGARHGGQDAESVRHLSGAGIVARIEVAQTAGFSIDTKWTLSLATNAWDGYDDPTCGRIVLLSRSKVMSRPEYLWAGTIAHELSHVAGFFHDGQKRAGNECTVPNLVGDVAEWTAWERTHRAADGSSPFVTWETVCSAFEVACRSDPHRRCTIGEAGITSDG